MGRLLKGQFLAVVGLQLRLVIERVHMAGAAMHEQEDHTFRPRHHMGNRPRRAGFALPGGAHAGKGEVAEPAGPRLQHGATGCRSGAVRAITGRWVHVQSSIRNSVEASRTWMNCVHDSWGDFPVAEVTNCSARSRSSAEGSRESSRE